MSRQRGVTILGVLLLLVVAVLSAAAWQMFLVQPAWMKKDAAQYGPLPELRLVKLSPEQYSNIILDTFGRSIEVPENFVEPNVRDNGLQAIGASRSSISSVGIERLDKAAHDIASQIVAASNRRIILGCEPSNASGADNDCAGQFLGRVSRLLLRRSLSEQELGVLVDTAATVAVESGDFYNGLKVVLQNLLISPEFFFRVERIEADDEASRKPELTAFSRASRLSFFLWNSGPDERLLSAAESGELESVDGLHTQVDRMLASPLVARGVRAFFADMLEFDKFASLGKDTAFYPRYVSDIPEEAQEQTLLTAVDHLLVKRADYRDLFTTKDTFLTPFLAALYGVPLFNLAPNGAADRFLPYRFDDDVPTAGILTHASFLALHSHPGRSSPTDRGKAIREQLLCQKVPPPPGDVDFSLVVDISNPAFRTARQRLSAHASQPACAGCHAITDPIGLSLENFDGAAGFRVKENGADIDPSGELNGATFADSSEMGRVLSRDPALTSCAVYRLYAYSVNRSPRGAELSFLRELEGVFARGNYDWVELMRAIATSDEFYRMLPERKRATSVPLFANSQSDPQHTLKSAAISK